jgi:hypothetical protein
MKTESEIQGFPVDLNEAVASRDFMRLVFEAGDEVNAGGGSLGQMLRTVITYCYARGVYSSSEIEWCAENNDDVRYLSAKHQPSAFEIRQFRRRNKKELQETLACVLDKLWKLHSASESMPFLAFLAEADLRVRAAIQADSAEMDV